MCTQCLVLLNPTSGKLDVTEGAIANYEVFLSTEVQIGAFVSVYIFLGSGASEVRCI